MKVRIAPSKYVLARLNCCDGRFASDPQYLFHALDLIERNVVICTVHSTKRKQFQTDATVGCLQNRDNMMYIIATIKFFSSFNEIQGTSQYFYNMLSDILAKIRKWCISIFSFLLSCRI